MKVLPLALVLSFLALCSCGQHMGPRDVDALPASKPTLVASYGEDPLQIGELRLPSGTGPFPVAIVIHGGCWTKGFATKVNTAPLASKLTEDGIATWNIEYRQVGDPGGGWPGTFNDWAAAADYLRTLAETQPLDLGRVVAVGHSAGAHAALWLAAREKITSESEIRGMSPLPLIGAVAIDGPGDLAAFAKIDDDICGTPVIASLMGGSPEQMPARYAQGSPIQLLPLGAPQYLVAAAVLTPGDAADYVRRASAKKDAAEALHVENSGHFDMIAPGNKAWLPVEKLILERAFKAKPVSPTN